MLEYAISCTAFAVAYLRAAHQLLDAPPRLLEDPVSLQLLGEGAGERIMGNADAYRTPEREHLRAHIVLRSRFAEDCLAAGAARGIRQYVVLGAGLDTFALRQPPWARTVQICEIDGPGTQAVKRARIAAAKLNMPANLCFAQIDFERETVRDGLRRTPVALDAPAFFSWLGVTMYLSEEAIDAVLRSVMAFPAGSEIVLTFATPPESTPAPYAQRASDHGEPWVSYFEPETMASKLRGAGFSTVEFLSPAEASERYFKNRPEDLPLPTQSNIARAVV